MSERAPIVYLDHAATTPVCAEVVEAMAPYWERDFANSASRTHRMGRQARVAVEKARDDISRALGLPHSERLIWTSGATESIRLAIEGALSEWRHSPNATKSGVQGLLPQGSRAPTPQSDAFAAGAPVVLTSAIEHRATRSVLAQLSAWGVCQWQQIPVNSLGQLDLTQLESALMHFGPQVALVSLILGHNEVGTLQNAQAIQALTRRFGVPLHWDAAQFFGKQYALPSDAQWISVSAHKLGGPKGVGALISPAGAKPDLHTGTNPVPLVIGFAAAVRRWVDAEGEFQYSLDRKTEALKKALEEQIPQIQWIGDSENRLSNHLALRVPGVTAAAWMQATSSVAFSSGSACGSDNSQPSPTYEAMGFTHAEASEIVRLVVWHTNSESELLQAAKDLGAGAQKVLEA